MSLDELIQQGQGLEPTTINWFDMHWITWIIFVLIVLVFILFLLLAIDDIKDGSLDLGSWVAGILVSSGIAFVVLFLGSSLEDNPEYAKWESEAHKYVKDLPQEKHEVFYIKLDPETTSDVKGTFFLFAGSIHTEIEKSTPVTIAYKDGEEVRYDTLWTKTNMKLSEDDKPYITFQNLPEDVGHGIDKGWYNPVIHLPRDYEFTDIK